MLRLVFMGSPDFAVPTLAALIEAGHTITAVYSQPPRPGGRGKVERPTPVHKLALDQGLMVRTPTTLKDAGEPESLAELAPDVVVVVAVGKEHCVQEHRVVPEALHADGGVPSGVYQVCPVDDGAGGLMICAREYGGRSQERDLHRRPACER